MSLYLGPVLFSILLWWAGTGLILYLDSLPGRSHRWTMLGATVLSIAALAGLASTRMEQSIGAAYLAFACAVAIWGWVETSFLLGIVTGPRRTPCPAGARGLKRALYAAQVVLYHEFALALGAALVAWSSSGGTNRVGIYTYAVLWVMRLSAKLNMHLGVRNRYAEFLPPHLAYVQSYFADKPINPLFPFSVILSSIAATLLWCAASASPITPYGTVSQGLVASMLTLAVLEHWMLVLPVHPEALWHWGIPGGRKIPAAAVVRVPRAP